MREKSIAANWKMNKTSAETRQYIEAFLPLLSGGVSVNVVLFAPFSSLSIAKELLAGSRVHLGAQNMHFESRGAYTGEMAPAMVAEFCEYVLVGHSDRRHLFGEDNAMLNKKLHAALLAGLLPIFCIGETAEEKAGGKTETILTEQLTEGLKGVSAEDAQKITIAYEPVWAISRGKSGVQPATSDDIVKAHGLVRATLAKLYSSSVADEIIIQYGGSVNEKNAREIFSLSNVDGGLVGNASLDPKTFAAIVQAAGA